jgi:16S rRNA (guanine527-N7)-methyltransferase
MEPSGIPNEETSEVTSSAPNAETSSPGPEHPPAPRPLAEALPENLPNSLPKHLPEHRELWQQTLGWQPSPAQQQQLQALYEGIVAGNRQLNLTRLTEPAEFWEKHLWDSLRALRPWLQAQGSLGQVSGQVSNQALDQVSGQPERAPKIIDIGTGGGFPGIPAAIAFPQAQVTLLDSTRKKMLFLQQLVEQLQLPQVSTVSDRAEVVGQQPSHRGQYDLALIRAVGPATVCAEYCLPLLRYGGTAILYRGQWTVDEAEALQEAAHLMGAELAEVDAFDTPLSQGKRHCLYLKKIAGTPDLFPRPVGVPVQDPLP